MEGMNRRELMVAAATACACMLLPEAEALAATPTTAPSPVELGTLADFAKENVYSTWTPKGFFVIRQKDRLFAASSACTHNANGKLVVKGNLISCPRHNAQFSFAGEVVKGPARRPLVRLAISIKPDGKIVVDPAKKFAQDQWEDKACFLKVE
jgi:nitrite reductase/ring-hydroxylating ferredoxin subunit